MVPAHGEKVHGFSQYLVYSSLSAPRVPHKGCLDSSQVAVIEMGIVIRGFADQTELVVILRLASVIIESINVSRLGF